MNTKFVKDLSGLALDNYVARALGAEPLATLGQNFLKTRLELQWQPAAAGGGRFALVSASSISAWWMPSQNWVQTGPLIERFGIAIVKFYEPKDGPIQAGSEWAALSLDDSVRADGPTPLIAVARCIITTEFGDAVPA